MKNKILFFLLSIFVGFSASTQTVYTDPALPTADEAVTVYFNATGTPLEGYSGSLYTHTGVTVNGSKWQYVIGDWGNNTNQPQLTSLGNNLYELDITPTIRDFYGVPAMDSITEMDFVFRSADNSLQTSPDIFIDVYELGLNISIVYPDMDPFFVNPGETINFSATATEALNVSLYVDDLLITTVTGNSLTYPITSSSDIDSKHWIKVVASGELLTVADSIYYYVRGVTEVAALPPGVVDGINYIDDQTVTLVLYAPYKNSVFAFGDFSNWEIGAEYKFKRTTSDPQSTDTRYWLTITGLQAGTEYAFQYLIDENLVIAEPYTDKVLDPWNDSYIDQSTYPNLKPYPAGKTNGIVSVLETGQQPYNWQVENFTPPDENNMVVYELLIRDFVAGT